MQATGGPRSASARSCLLLLAALLVPGPSPPRWPGAGPTFLQPRSWPGCRCEGPRASTQARSGRPALPAFPRAEGAGEWEPPNRGKPGGIPAAGHDLRAARGWPSLLVSVGALLAARRRHAAPRLGLFRRAQAEEGTKAADGEEPAGTEELQVKEPRPPLWRRMLGSIKRNGVGYFFAYGLVSNVNGCGLLAISWALFVKTRDICPVKLSPDLPLVVNVLVALFRPTRMNPQFLLYYGAVYLSVGSIMRPLRMAVAAGLVPFVKKFFDVVQDRLGCPRPLTWVIALVSMTALSAVAFPTLVLLACAVLRVPVAPA
mmetsp:Transcript_105891/g.326754  ORF Transcript_105891/g.326754 Transcript_105891/m.326754 type:complete len:315 (-) Transcript_105891:41-985(-)